MNVPNKVEPDGLLYVLGQITRRYRRMRIYSPYSDEGFDKGSFETHSSKKT